MRLFVSVDMLRDRGPALIIGTKPGAAFRMIFARDSIVGFAVLKLGFVAMHAGLHNDNTIQPSTVGPSLEEHAFLIHSTK
jgi:hypothetical protein